MKYCSLRTNSLAAAGYGTDSDSTRIMIARRKLFFIKQGRNYDEWIKELAPSDDLLNMWNTSKKTDQDWQTYEDRFFPEMKEKSALEALEKLRQRVRKGEIITLLCYCSEKDIKKHCHRHLIKSLIERDL